METSFILFRLPPHFRNFSKRVVKSPKIYFHDTGLACYLLGIREPDMLPTHPLRGALFENYVMAEVAKAFVHHRRQRDMHFWRDRTGREVDLLLSRGEQLYPVEIKSGQTVAGDALGRLSGWCEMAGQPLDQAALVYGGEQDYVRSGGAVHPWFGIWDPRIFHRSCRSFRLRGILLRATEDEEAFQVPGPRSQVQGQKRRGILLRFRLPPLQ